MGLQLDLSASKMPFMASKKKPADRSADRHKPGRMVRIPERLCVLLDKWADAEFNTISDHVRAAVIAYLQAKGEPKRLG
jgi:hypothetical protein